MPNAEGAKPVAEIIQNSALANCQIWSSCQAQSKESNIAEIV